MSLYRQPGKYVRFGDVFDATHLFTTYLRGDAVALGADELPANLVPMLGKKLGLALPEEPLQLYSPYLRKRAQEDFVLAHGDLERAIILTDNCTIATIFGYERDRARRTGRLMFAAVRDEPAEIEKVVRTQPFNRFGLEAAAFFSGGVVDFRRLFVVDARDAEPAQRVASLGEELAEALAVRFSAYAVRRGPNVVDRNVDKLVGLLTRAGVGEPAAQASGARIAESLGVAWRLEGGALEDTAEAFDDKKDPAESLELLASEFRALAASAHAAADDLERRLAGIT